MSYQKSTALFTALFMTLTFFSGCSTAAAPDKKAASKTVSTESKPGGLIQITRNGQFQDLLTNANDTLLVFKLYADWCSPCRILEPTMEKIARENGGKVKYFKVDVDKLPDIAATFGASSIPLVVMVKNQKAVDGFAGVRQEKEYVAAIHKHLNATGTP